MGILELSVYKTVSHLIPLQSGPADLVNFDPEFTQLPVPPSLGVCEGSGLAFPGFSYQ